MDIFLSGHLLKLLLGVYHILFIAIGFGFQKF
jgi:hypothetical protein